MEGTIDLRPSLKAIKPEVSPKSVIILVPGVDTEPVENWKDDENKPWPQSLPETVLPTPVIYEFRYCLDITKDSCWTALITNGHTLAQQLNQLLNEQKELRSCPIVFVAHSLGGLIVKSCITNAGKPEPGYRKLAIATAIFVAVASPHSSSDDTAIWTFPQRIVRAQRHSARAKNTTEADARKLSKLCENFEKVAVDLPLSILSVCEDKEVPSKSFVKKLLARRSLLLGSTRAWTAASTFLVVPKDCAQVGLEHPQEEITCVTNATHFDIPLRLPSEWLRNKIADNFRDAFQRVQQRVADRTPSLPSEETPTVISGSTQINDQRMSMSTTVVQSVGTEEVASLQGMASMSDDRADGLMDASPYTTTKRDPRLPCRLIPSNSDPEFTGREEVLEEIHSKLKSVARPDPVDARVRSFAICGPGGMGKTHLANEYALRYKKTYDAVFWLDASNPSKLAEQFSRIAISLGLVLEGSADARDHYLACEHVKGWLSKPVRSYKKADNTSAQEVSWLVVFDDVEDPQALLDYWPTASSNGSILVTSRDHTAAKPGLYPVTHGTVLEPLPVDDAAELLLRLTWREEDANEKVLSKEVARTLGGLPLALVRMAAISVAQEISFAEIMKRLSSPDALYLDILSSVWKFETLRYSTGLLDVMVFLDPNAIPESLLKSAVGKSPLSGYPQTMRQFHEACAEMHRHSLVSEDRTGSNLTIHRIVQDTAKTNLLLNPVRANAVFEAAIDLLWEQWPRTEPGVRHVVGNWNKCAMLVPHAANIKDYYLNADDHYQTQWRKSFKFAALLNELGWYFQERGRGDDALECFKITQRNAAHILSLCDTHDCAKNYDKVEAQRLLAEAHGNIAGAATDLNDANSALLSYMTYHHMLMNEHRGMDIIPDARLTTSYYDVGMSYTMQGAYAEAVKWLKEAIREAGRLQGEAKVKSARSLALINLGLTYWLMGRHDQAQERLLVALREREELFGPNDRQSMITGRVLHSLGNVRRSLGDLSQSLSYHKQALVHFMETVGEHHHRTGNSSFKVAEHFFEMHEYPRALMLCGQAWKVFHGRPCYRGEAGRVLILQSQVLERMGLVKRSTQTRQRAEELYHQLGRSISDDGVLVTADFDSFVHVWGR